MSSASGKRSNSKVGRMLPCGSVFNDCVDVSQEMPFETQRSQGRMSLHRNFASAQALHAILVLDLLMPLGKPRRCSSLLCRVPCLLRRSLDHGQRCRCIEWWYYRLAKHFPQISHENGLSLVSAGCYISECLFRGCFTHVYGSGARGGPNECRFSCRYHRRKGSQILSQPVCAGNLPLLVLVLIGSAMYILNECTIFVWSPAKASYYLKCKPCFNSKVMRHGPYGLPELYHRSLASPVEIARCDWSVSCNKRAKARMKASTTT